MSEDANQGSLKATCGAGWFQEISYIGSQSCSSNVVQFNYCSQLSTTFCTTQFGPNYGLIPDIDETNSQFDFYTSYIQEFCTGSAVQACNSAGTTVSIKTCFGGAETVQMEDGTAKRIVELHVGDRILSADSEGKTRFSAVVALPHEPNSMYAVLSHITTEQGKDIKLSGDHLILSGACGSALALVEAKTVVSGHCVLTVDGQEVVSSNQDTGSQDGLYTVVTEDDFVVVNGFVASPFSTNHVVANAFYNVHRMAFQVAPVLLQTKWLRSAVEVFGGVVASA